MPLPSLVAHDAYEAVKLLKFDLLCMQSHCRRNIKSFVIVSVLPSVYCLWLTHNQLLLLFLTQTFNVFNPDNQIKINVDDDETNKTMQMSSVFVLQDCTNWLINLLIIYSKQFHVDCVRYIVYTLRHTYPTP